MHNFRNIFILQIRNMFRGDRSKKSRGRYVAYIGLAVLYALMMELFTPVVYRLSGSFSQLGLKSEFVTIILLVGLMMVLVFGIVTVLTTLYFSRDTEFFLSLPIRPSTVFAAKMAVVYGIEAATTLLLMAPLLISAGIGMHMSALYYVLIPLAILSIPAIPLFFAAIIAIPVMYIVSFLRNRGTVGSVLVILLFGVFFGAYYFALMKVQNIDPETADLESVRGIFVNMSKLAYPLYALARAMTTVSAYGLGRGASTAVGLLIYAGSVAAFAVVAFLISATVYRKGAASQLENAKRTTNKAASYHGTSVVRTLMKKEWREIIRTPAFAMNCLLGIVCAPLIVGFFTYMTRLSGNVAYDQMDASTRMINDGVMQFFVLWFLAFMCTGTNSAPTTTFTREGDKFLYCKILPIDYRTQIKAKARVGLLIGTVSIVLGLAVYAVLVRDFVFVPCAAVFLLLYNYAYVHFAMLADLTRPKLKWTSPNEAIKHNRNVVLMTFGGAGVSVVSVFLGGLIYILCALRGHTTLGSVLCWTLLTILGFALSAISSSLLYMRSKRKFDAVEL